MKAIFSPSFAVAAIAIALALSSASAQPAATTPPPAPIVAAPAPTPLSAAIAAAVSLCMPPTFALAGFESRANAAGWTAFATNAAGEHEWRVSDRTIDPGHRISVAGASGPFAGAPRPTRSFNCKIVLQPGAVANVHATLAAVFGEDGADGGFFIREQGALRPMTFDEMLTEFPASLGNLTTARRMVFMEADQRGSALVISVDSFEAGAAR